MRAPGNHEIADTLDQIADLLAAQGGDAFRVRAYRRAGDTARKSARPLAEIVEADGPEALAELPAIGKSIAISIGELVYSGRIALLERLRGQISPEDLFTTLPGIGDALAQRLHQVLDIETLEQLELCAHDGRLEAVPGFGRRRVQALRDLLAARLSRSAWRRARFIPSSEPAGDTPSVELLLDVDDEYRTRNKREELPRIAPRRFNAEGKAWLSILHTTRGSWNFTALHSNTARAHELGKTGDWVILFYEENGHEGQCTVVTEVRGPLAGRRVVRGREAECGALLGRNPGSDDQKMG